MRTTRPTGTTDPAPAAPTPTHPGQRRPWRTDRLTTLWMIVSLLVATLVLLAHDFLPQPLWTAIHVVTLGILTNAIFQWSWFFARALLHLPSSDTRSGRDAALRVFLLNGSFLALVVGMWGAHPWLVVAGATLIGTVAAWHGLALVGAMRTRLGNRFAVVIRYYVAASAWLVLGCVLAGLIALAMFDPSAPPWLVSARDRMTLSHALVNLAGWVGLSMAGTLVTLGPTMLHTQIDPEALMRAVRALPGACVALALAAAGTISGIGLLHGGGLTVYAAILLWGIGVPLLRSAVHRLPRAYATWTLTAGTAWSATGVLAVSWLAITSAPTDLRNSVLKWLTILGAGGLAQIFVAALTYLMPVAVGGGPAAMRAGMKMLAQGGPARVAVRNTALVLVAATPGASATDPTGLLHTLEWMLVVVSYALDVIQLARAGACQARAKREQGTTLPPTTVAPLTLGRVTPATPVDTDGAPHER